MSQLRQKHQSVHRDALPGPSQEVARRIPAQSRPPRGAAPSAPAPRAGLLTSRPPPGGSGAQPPSPAPQLFPGPRLPLLSPSEAGGRRPPSPAAIAPARAPRASHRASHSGSKGPESPFPEVRRRRNRMAPPLPEATPTLEAAGTGGTSVRPAGATVWPASQGPQGGLSLAGRPGLFGPGASTLSARSGQQRRLRRRGPAHRATRPGLPQVRRRGLKGAAPRRNAGGRPPRGAVQEAPPPARGLGSRRWRCAQ